MEDSDSDTAKLWGVTDPLRLYARKTVEQLYGCLNEFNKDAKYK